MDNGAGSHIPESPRGRGSAVLSMCCRVVALALLGWVGTYTLAQGKPVFGAVVTMMSSQRHKVLGANAAPWMHRLGSYDGCNQPSQQDKALNEDFDTLWAPALTSVAHDLGKYDGCANGMHEMVWIFLGGHLRTFSEHLGNFKSFLAPCSFVILYTRSVIEAPGKAWWGDRQAEAGVKSQLSPLEVLKDISEQHFTTNFAWHVVKQEDTVKREDVWPGMLMLMASVAREHGIELRPHQVVVMTRPDIIFSHTIAFDRLINMSHIRHYDSVRRRAHPDWIYLVRHERNIGNYDPSELFEVASLGFLENTFSTNSVLCAREFPSKDISRCTWAVNITACRRHRVPPVGGHVYRNWFVHDQICEKTQAYFITNALKIHIHRLSGGWRTAVNRPGGNVDPQAISNGRLDITKGLARARGRNELSVCFNKTSNAPDEDLEYVNSLVIKKTPVLDNDFIWIEQIDDSDSMRA